MGGHSSWRPAPQATNPDDHGETPCLFACERRAVPIRFCSRWGYRRPPRCLRRTFHFSPCRSFRAEALATCSLLHFPLVSPAEVIRHRCFGGARTFLARFYTKPRAARPSGERRNSKTRGKREENFCRRLSSVTPAGYTGRLMARQGRRNDWAFPAGAVTAASARRNRCGCAIGMDAISSADVPRPNRPTARALVFLPGPCGGI